MYMPAQVQVKYNAEYGDTEIGVLTGSAVDVVEALMAGKDVNMEKLGKDVKDAGVAMEKTAIGMVGDLGPGLEWIKRSSRNEKGVISSDRLELAFKGIEKRSFSYEFKMMPRSQAEADEIAEIINAFKFHMLPEMPNGLGGRQMTSAKYI